MIKCSDIISSCCHSPNTFSNNSGKIYANGSIVCSEKCSHSTGHRDDCCYLCKAKCYGFVNRESEFVYFLKNKALQKAQMLRKVSR